MSKIKGGAMYKIGKKVEFLPKLYFLERRVQIGLEVFVKKTLTPYYLYGMVFVKKNAHSVSFVRNGFRKKYAHYGVVTNLDNFCDRIFNGAEVNPKWCRSEP